MKCRAVYCPNNPHRQRGVALLTAMLIIALVAIIGAGMLSQMNLALHRSGNIWESEQAWWYAVGIENWLGKLLRQDAQLTKIDSLDEPWAKPVDYLPLEGGALSGRLVDLQSRFNLNNLAGDRAKAAQQQFIRLIQLVADTDNITARTIAAATRDWLDRDINPTGAYGAEDDYYLGLDPAYRAGDGPMASASELRLVKGVTDTIYAALAPYICVLPQTTPINVNTAPAPILATLAEGLPPSTGQALVKAREDEPWDSVGKFMKEDAMAGTDDSFKPESLSVTTHYFMAQGKITVDQAQVRFFSLLERADNGAVQVVRHSTNVD